MELAVPTKSSRSAESPHSRLRSNSPSERVCDAVKMTATHVSSSTSSYVVGNNRNSSNSNISDSSNNRAEELRQETEQSSMLAEKGTIRQAETGKDGGSDEVKEGGEEKHTSAVNRGIDDIDANRFMFYTGLFSAARISMQHPFTIAVARMQTCPTSASLGTRAVLRNMFRQEGFFRACTLGMAAYVCGTAASDIIYFYLYELTRARLPMASETARDASAGFTADFSSRFIYTPFLLVANRQMTAPYVEGMKRKNAWQVARTVHREAGVQGLFKGLGTTLLMGSAWSGVWWALYGGAKHVLYENVPAAALALHDRLPAAQQEQWQSYSKTLPACMTSSEDNMFINASASIFCSSVSGFMFNPFLVIRTRLQVTPNSSLLSVTKSVIREAGWRGFFAGAVLNTTQCTVDGLIAGQMYEWAKLLSDNSVGRS